MCESLSVKNSERHSESEEDPLGDFLIVKTILQEKWGSSQQQ